MKNVALIAGLLASSVAVAQQVDPVSSAYGQLLSEANLRVARLAAQVQNEHAQIDEMQKQLDAKDKEIAALKAPAAAPGEHK